MLVSPDQVLCHMIGDFVLQSDWMASEKTSKLRAALAHALAYGLPFLFLQPSMAAWAFIMGSHFVVDHWRLARHVGWVKNFLAPPHVRVGDSVEPNFEKVYWLRNHPWSECSGTGYERGKPAWMAVWLMIIVDQMIHVLLNALAIKYL